MKNFTHIFFFIILLAATAPQLSYAQTPLLNRAWVDTVRQASVAQNNLAAATDGINLYALQDVNGYQLRKIATNGNTAWLTQINSDTNITAYETAISIKNGYLFATGFSYNAASGTAVINTIKLNANTGDTIFTRSYQGSYGGYDISAAIISDDSGNIYVAGTSETGILDFAMVLIKYDSLGNQLFISSYDSAGLYSGAVAMALTPHGNIVLTGVSGTGFSSYNFLTAWFSPGGTLRHVAYSANSGTSFSQPVGIIRGQDNSITIAGTAATSGASIIKLVNYDSTFAQHFITTYGDSVLPETASAIAADGNGNLAVSGTATNATGGTNMVALCFNQNTGALKWSRQISAPNPAAAASAASVAYDNNGNAIITGQVFNGNNYVIQTVSLTAANGNTNFVAPYSANGATAAATSVLVDSANNIYLTGNSAVGADTTYVAMQLQQFTPTPCKTISDIYFANDLSSVCPTITYSFQNAHVTTAGTDTFAEFDIYAEENFATLSFANANIYFTYSGRVFGNNVVDSGNITVTPGTITANTNYVISLTDTLLKSSAVPPGGGEVQLSINANTDTGNLYVIGDTGAQLCHVKMKLIGYGNCQIGFDQFFMQNNSVFVNYSATDYTYVYTYGLVGTLRAGDINVQIANASYTSSPGYLTFDVQVQSDDADPFYDADAIITYNTDNFGTNVKSNGNLNCSFNSSAINSGQYDLTVSDATSASFEISVTENSSVYATQYPYADGPPTNITNINNYTTLATCSLAVQKCCYASGAYLTPTSITGDYAPFLANTIDTIQTNWYYYQTDQTAYSAGSLTGYNNSGNNICPASGTTPVITGLDPLTITAGTFSVLTITGSGFGCTPGQVLFPNANDGGASMMNTQTPDIQSWQDNQIKVWVPSAGSSVQTPAGSGQIEVQTSGGTVSSLSGSSLSLTIPYAAFNERDASYNPIYIGLINQNGTGGYTFTPDNSINSTSLATITQAMNDWICQTGVNFTMGAGASGLTQNPDDGINSLFFGTLPAGSLAATYTAFKPSQLCTTNTPGVNYFSDIDMVISSTADGGTWDYTNTTTPASGDKSLLGAVRHEFGHASGIDHVINTSDLMFWQSLAVSAPAVAIQHDDQNGGLYVLTNVGDNQLLLCYPINQQAFPTGCPTLTIENGIKNIAFNPFNLSVYPNPFDDDITIKADLDQPAPIKVSIFDILGQTVVSQNFGTKSGTMEESVNVSVLGAGMYIMRVFIGGQYTLVKLVKK